MLPRELIDKDSDKIKEELFRDGLEDYKRIPVKKNENQKLKQFLSYIIGGERNSNTTTLKTEIGEVSIKAKSQFFKMRKHKEDRTNLLLGIKETLEDPMLIYKEGDSYKFFNGFKKKEGSIFYMASVCRKTDDDNLSLVTSYQIRNLSTIKKFLEEERGMLIYNGLDSAVGRAQRASVSQEVSESKTENDSIFQDGTKSQINTLDNGVKSDTKIQKCEKNIEKTESVIHQQEPCSMRYPTF